MKIADYGKAITSYIESPTTAQKLQAKEKAQTLGRTLLAEGSEDIVEPSKSMQVDTTTKGLDLFTIDDFKDKAEIYVGAYHNKALPLADIKSALNKFTQKGIDDGTFSADDAIKIVQDLKFQFQDRAQKQRLREVVPEGIGTVEREDFKRGTNLTNLEKKQNLYKKALKELPKGYLEDYKNIFLTDRGDGTFSRKSGEEGGFDFMRKKYGDQIKQIKTRQGFTKNINEKIKQFNNAILQNLKKENKIVSGLKDKDAKRTKSIREAQGRDIKFKAPKGYQAHHMLPLGSRIGMTNRDVAIISKEMNAALSKYDKPMNKLVEKSMKINFSKDGSLKELDDINKKLASYVEKAEKELPKKYKGLIGFNKLTPVLDTFDEKGKQVFGVEKIGTDYKKSIGGKTEEKLLKDIPTKELQKLTADAPKFSVPIKILKSAGKVIKPLGYAFGANAVKSAISKADDMGIELSLSDKIMAFDSGDADIAINNYRRRNDPEFAAAERAKDLAKMTDDFEEVGQTTFGKYNDQIKNIKLP